MGRTPPRPRGVITLEICPFCGWPDAPEPSRPDNGARGRTQEELLRHGADAFGDRLYEHVNQWHITDEDVPED